MGSLRLFLAISVIVGHTTPLAGLEFMPTYRAMWLFFIISGFYMQLISVAKYAGDTLTFYSNRTLRLYPTYFVALLLAAALCDWSQFFDTLPAGAAWPVAIANLTLFGSDVVFHLGYDHMVIAPAWSLGLEIWFYLLVPWLAVLPAPWLVAIAACSFALRLWMEYAQPWSSYFFFPANLFFFVTGMLAFRAMPLLDRLKERKTAVIRSVAVLALAALFAREFIPGFRNYVWMQCTLRVLTLPFIFQASKDILADRAIGDLSYSAYLLQAPVIAALTLFDRSRVTGAAAVATTLALSVIVYHGVEAPIDR